MGYKWDPISDTGENGGRVVVGLSHPTKNRVMKPDEYDANERLWMRDIIQRDIENATADQRKRYVEFLRVFDEMDTRNARPADVEEEEL